MNKVEQTLIQKIDFYETINLILVKEINNLSGYLESFAKHKSDLDRMSNGEKISDEIEYEAHVVSAGYGDLIKIVQSINTIENLFKQVQSLAKTSSDARQYPYLLEKLNLLETRFAEIKSLYELNGAFDKVTYCNQLKIRVSPKLFTTNVIRSWHSQLDKLKLSQKLSIPKKDYFSLSANAVSDEKTRRQSPAYQSNQFILEQSASYVVSQLKQEARVTIFVGSFQKTYKISSTRNYELGWQQQVSKSNPANDFDYFLGKLQDIYCYDPEYCSANIEYIAVRDLTDGVIEMNSTKEASRLKIRNAPKLLSRQNSADFSCVGKLGQTNEFQIQAFFKNGFCTEWSKKMTMVIDK